MTRWIAAAGVILGMTATGLSKPPGEGVPQGKERTQVERDLYLSEPHVTVTAMKLTQPTQEPEPTNPFEAVWAAAVRLACGPLGTVPLVPREKW